jgi:hypothetical protein
MHESMQLFCILHHASGRKSVYLNFDGPSVGLILVIFAGHAELAFANLSVRTRVLFHLAFCAQHV